MRRYRIGRSDNNDIVVADASVSRNHAELEEIGGGRFRLKDLGSANGTAVWNGQDWIGVSETEIDRGTSIQIGTVQTTAEALIPAAAPPPSVSPAAAEAPAAAAPEPAMPAPGAAAPASPSPRFLLPDEPSLSPPPAAAPASAPPQLPPRKEQRDRVAKPPARPEQAARPERPPRPAPPARAARPPRDERPARDDRPAPVGVFANKRLMLWLGLGIGGFLLVAAAAIALILLTDGGRDTPRTDPPPRTDPARSDPPANAADGQRRFLETCTKEWSEEERRCRCILAAVGSTLHSDDYADFTDLIEAHRSADPLKTASVLQSIGQKRGGVTATRMSNAYKAFVRDCQQ